jgi:hypothetical protein
MRPPCIVETCTTQRTTRDDMCSMHVRNRRRAEQAGHVYTPGIKGPKSGAPVSNAYTIQDDSVSDYIARLRREFGLESS